MKTLRGKRILVTGGAGFIGSNLTRHLVMNVGAEVVNVDKLTYAGSLASLADVKHNALHHFEHIDICDATAIEDAFTRFRPTAVMHLAAESHVDRSIDGSAEFIKTNIVGTHVLLESALRFWKSLAEADRKKFVFHHVSTDEVYGSLGAEGKFTEITAYRPNSPYSATKAASDHLVRAWHRTYGLPVILTNCSNNYGPYQFPEKLIPVVVLNCLDGRPVPVYGSGDNVRDWLYVQDHVEALVDVLEKGAVGETYNIGGNNEVRNIDLVRMLCTLLDTMAPRPDRQTHAALITYVADRPGHDKRYAIDASKLARDLGWKPKEDLESGLAKTIRWYLGNRKWCEDITKGIYDRERLGLASVQ